MKFTWWTCVFYTLSCDFVFYIKWYRCLLSFEKHTSGFFSRNDEVFFLNAVLHAKRCVAFTGFKPVLLEGRLKGDHHAI